MLDLLLLLARLLLSHGRDYTVASAHVRRVGGCSRGLLLLVDANATAQTLMTWMLLLLSRMVTTNAQVLVLARSSSVHGSQGMMHLLLLLLLSLLLLLHVIIGGLLGLRVLLLLAELSQVVLLLLLAVRLLHWRVPVADVMRWRTTRLVLLRMVTGGHARSDRDTVRGLHGNTGLGLGHSWVHAAVGLRVVRGHATLLLWVLLLGLSLGSGILLLLLLLGLGNGGAVTALTRGHHHVLLNARVLLLHLGRVLLHRVAGHVLAITGRGERGKREVDG